MRRFLTYITGLAIGMVSAYSQATTDSIATPNIVDAINSNPDATVTVVLPHQLELRVQPSGSSEEAAGGQEQQKSTSSRRAGYRIQVFSDNNQRTAKANAEYRKRSIEQRMPGTRAYLLFESPYWRVRVGDYSSHSEAEAAMAEIRSAFPAFSSDLRIVRERVNMK